MAHIKASSLQREAACALQLFSSRLVRFLQAFFMFAKVVWPTKSTMSSIACDVDTWSRRSLCSLTLSAKTSIMAPLLSKLYLAGPD